MRVNGKIFFGVVFVCINGPINRMSNFKSIFSMLNLKWLEIMDQSSSVSFVVPEKHHVFGCPVARSELRG